MFSLSVYSIEFVTIENCHLVDLFVIMMDSFVDLMKNDLSSCALFSCVNLLLVRYI